MDILKNIKINSVTESSIEEYVKLIGKIGIVTSFLGAVTQYINLVLIGSGTWILSYFSITFIIFEGINYMIYYILFLIAFSKLGEYIAIVIITESAFYKIFLGVTLFASSILLLLSLKGTIYLFIAAPFLFLIYSFPLYLLFYGFNKKAFTERIKESRKDKNNIPLEIDFFRIFLFSIITLNIFNYFVPKGIINSQKNIFVTFPVLKKEFNNSTIIKKYYKNDNYLFIKFIDEKNRDRLMIKKIDDLLNEKEKASIIKTLPEL